METEFKTGLVWLRRDLRLQDNAALALALQCCEQVHCAFLFDRAILDPLPRRDRRVDFIHAALCELDARLQQADGGLIALHGHADTEIPALARLVGAQAVFAAHDYEPAAIARDAAVEGLLAGEGIRFQTVKDHVVFEKREVLTQGGQPYTVFTPYKRAWLARLAGQPLQPHDSESALAKLAPRLETRPLPSLSDLGFEPSNLAQLRIPTGESGAQALLADFLQRIAAYADTRDFPAVKGPSYLSMHLRFGTVSIRQLVALAAQHQSSGAATWLSELVWREFYFQILANFPHVVGHAFKPAYDAIAWEEGAQADALFAAWCEGRTGYPLVDAAMAQLNRTGYMHNRLRMVAGSFLVKHLGIDWRRGEAYFAQTLNDFDLSANNGGWQWVASSGCDAQPYFRIFNPVTQSEKFDTEGKFILRYLPQLQGLSGKALHAPWLAKKELDYPQPVVDHAKARAKTLLRYGALSR